MSAWECVFVYVGLKHISAFDLSVDGIRSVIYLKLFSEEKKKGGRVRHI